MLEGVIYNFFHSQHNRFGCAHFTIKTIATVLDLVREAVGVCKCRTVITLDAINALIWPFVSKSLTSANRKLFFGKIRTTDGKNVLGSKCSSRFLIGAPAMEQHVWFRVWRSFTR